MFFTALESFFCINFYLFAVLAQVEKPKKIVIQYYYNILIRVSQLTFANHENRDYNYYIS